MCNITKQKRTCKVTSLEEAQTEIYRDTLDHMVEQLYQKKSSSEFYTARDFDTYQIDDEDLVKLDS